MTNIFLLLPIVGIFTGAIYTNNGLYTEKGCIFYYLTFFGKRTQIMFDNNKHLELNKNIFYGFFICMGMVSGWAIGHIFSCVFENVLF